MSVLVVASHPDDEVLGCGGTIAKLAAQGEEVTVLILGEGVTSRLLDQAEESSALENIKLAAEKASSTLGVLDLRMCQYPDNCFDTVPLIDIVRSVEHVIEEIQPHTVLCQHGGDLNIDHQKTFQAVLTATRPIPGQSVTSVLSWQTNSSTDWAFFAIEPIFRPNLYIDISATLKEKMRALLAYKDEMRPFPHSRSLEAVEAADRANGATVGVDAAETFSIVRVVR